MGRGKKGVAATVSVLALLAVGLAVWQGGNRRQEAEEREARHDPDVATGSGTAGIGDGTEATFFGKADGELSETATAWVVRGDGTQMEIQAIDHEFDRLDVAPNEVLCIRLALAGGDATRPILVEADNGGSLERRAGPLVLPPSEDGAVWREFRYAVGGNKGKYSLCISQGDRQEVMPFYAGQEPRTGIGGPSRSFHPELPKKGGGT